MVDLVIQSEPPKELDTYVHRAGRTARAGRFGIAITLYTKREEDLITRIEQRAKIKFKKIGAPQKTDIIDSNIRDIKENLEKVDGSIVRLFSKPATVLVEKHGGEDAVARLLALLSGI
jgi:ATP-dependent RNA helicase DDX21